MATTGIMNGTLIGLYKSVSSTMTKIANGRSTSVDISIDMIEITTKDSAGYKEFIPGEKGGTFDFEGLLEQDGSIGGSLVSPSDLVTDALAGTAITVRWSSQVSGDTYYESSAYITNVNFSAPNNAEATFTCSLQMTGTITQGTVTP
jgi:predicted secreted protein